jgi:hypothetical protein
VALGSAAVPAAAETPQRSTDLRPGSASGVNELDSLRFFANEAATGSELWWVDPFEALLSDGFGPGETSGEPLP